MGTHFFSPVPMMRLCELIRGLQTSDETMSCVEEFAESIGKETVIVRKDVAGFIANRVGPGDVRRGHEPRGSREWPPPRISTRP